MKEKTKWIRNCPNCGSVLFYVDKFKLNRANDSKSKCKSCSLRGRVFTEEAKRNMSIAQQNMTDETKSKISNGLMGHRISEETRRKISESHMGKSLSTNHKLKLSETLTGRIHSKEHKRKIRKSYCEYLKKCGGKTEFIPTYNKSSIPIIEAKAKELGITDLQHAENGGEYHIKELGYWVDGYSAEKNIVIEYDEKHHKRQVEKDQRRQKEIIENLNCEFIRISE